jgi:hypothetical protein
MPTRRGCITLQKTVKISKRVKWKGDRQNMKRLLGEAVAPTTGRTNLRRYATSRNVKSSSPYDVIESFQVT